MKEYLGVLVLFLLLSCKTKAIVNEGSASNELTSEKIIVNNYKHKKGFSTLNISAGAKYKDEKNSQSVSAEVKIKRDEKILVIVRVLGFTVAKALITPDKVKYYEKINNTYFEGDYQSLSQWLGTDLDFQKVQNLLIGEAIDDLNKSVFTNTIINKMYKLSNTDGVTEKSFFFEPEQFLLNNQQVVQAEKGREFNIDYSNFQEISNTIMPTHLDINAIQKKGKTNISIDYKTVTFNEELTFPYSVPEGYERVFID
jgi:hypothetical protein